MLTMTNLVMMGGMMLVAPFATKISVKFGKKEGSIVSLGNRFGSLYLAAGDPDHKSGCLYSGNVCGIFGTWIFYDGKLGDDQRLYRQLLC